MDKAYIENCVLSSPGFVIKAGGSAIVKAGSAFVFKQNGYISTPISANQDMAGLATSKGIGNTASTNLADGYGRIYTFLASIDPETGTITYSVVHGEDFLNTRLAKTSDRNYGNPENQDFKKVVLGFAHVLNESGAEFVPGTTALDATDITVRYGNAFGYVGQ